MTTVSDDRTICIWSWNHLPNEEYDSLTNNTYTLCRVLVGHTARVWRSAILDDVIISIAEVIYCTNSWDNLLAVKDFDLLYYCFLLLWLFSYIGSVMDFKSLCALRFAVMY